MVALAAPAWAEALPQRDVYVARVVELTNAERQKAGLAPLGVSPELGLAAASYSQLLASTGCFAHTCGPVPEMTQRDEQAGYLNWTALGENLAAGYATPEAVVAGWMASPGHRANILNPAFKQIGVGVASASDKYGTYAVQEFGARPGGEPAFQALDAGATQMGAAPPPEVSDDAAPPDDGPTDDEG